MNGEAMADALVGILMVPLGLLGLVLASGAVDGEMYLFGLSLAAFCAAFGFGVLKRHYDAADRVPARIQRPVPHV